MRKLLRCDSEVSWAVSGDAIEYIYRGMIVRGWGYLDYLNSIRVDVAEGLEVLGYDVFQSLYFAYSSLELKLQHDPDEVVFALTAVLVVIMERGVLPEYKDTDEFVVGFMGCCAGGGVGLALRCCRVMIGISLMAMSRGWSPHLGVWDLSEVMSEFLSVFDWRLFEL